LRNLGLTKLTKYFNHLFKYFIPVYQI